MENFARKVKLVKISKRGIVAAVATAGLLFSGLTAVPAQAADKVINVWSDEGRGPALKSILEGNKKIAPGYTFKVKVYSGYDALDSAWKKASAAGGPDVMFHPAGEGVNAAKSGKALPLTFSATAKSQLGTAALGAGTYKGRTYVVPLDVDTTTMIWNTKFGATAPKTLAAMVDLYKTKKACQLPKEVISALKVGVVTFKQNLTVKRYYATTAKTKTPAGLPVRPLIRKMTVRMGKLS